VFLSTRKIHHYIEATVSSVEPMDSFSLVRFGKSRLAKPPVDCLLVKDTKVQLTYDPYTKMLLYIASDICATCPLSRTSGNGECRYGTDV
jgi:hypothetical protein